MPCCRRERDGSQASSYTEADERIRSGATRAAARSPQWQDDCVDRRREGALDDACYPAERRRDCVGWNDAGWLVSRSAVERSSLAIVFRCVFGELAPRFGHFDQARSRVGIGCRLGDPQTLGSILTIALYRVWHSKAPDLKSPNATTYPMFRVHSITAQVELG